MARPNSRHRSARLRKQMASDDSNNTVEKEFATPKNRTVTTMPTKPSAKNAAHNKLGVFLGENAGIHMKGENC